MAELVYKPCARAGDGYGRAAWVIAFFCTDASRACGLAPVARNLVAYGGVLLAGSLLLWIAPDDFQPDIDGELFRAPLRPKHGTSSSSRRAAPINQA